MDKSDLHSLVPWTAASHVSAIKLRPFGWTSDPPPPPQGGQRFVPATNMNSAVSPSAHHYLNESASISTHVRTVLPNSHGLHSAHSCTPKQHPSIKLHQGQCWSSDILLFSFASRNIQDWHIVYHFRERRRAKQGKNKRSNPTVEKPVSANFILTVGHSAIVPLTLTV